MHTKLGIELHKNYSNLILRSDEELASTNDKEYTKKLFGGVIDAKY